MIGVSKRMSLGMVFVTWAVDGCPVVFGIVGGSGSRPTGIEGRAAMFGRFVGIREQGTGSE